MKNFPNEFSIVNSGHAILMQSPTQPSSKEYDALRNEYIKILEEKKLSFETDKVDNRRSIEVVKANKMSLQQLIDLLELNKTTQSLLTACHF